MALGQLTLNEMFKEVEKLMEDTQQKLEEAVHQVGEPSSCPFPTPVVDKQGCGGSDPLNQLSLKLDWSHKYLA